MKLEDPWKPFHQVAEEPFEQARVWKERTGRKVIGHLLPDVPEEILHAAGALPVAIAGAGVQVSRAQAHIPGYSCSHAMGALELGLRGDLELLDGMVIPYVCDTTRNLYHLWNRCFPTKANEFLRLPKRMDYPAASAYLKTEFARLADAMGKITGETPGRKELASSVALYDKSRARLREAYRKQKEHSEVWTSQRVYDLSISAIRMPREEHLAWMEALPWDNETSETSERVPVYVRGKVWDPPGILGLFDELGLLVVEDEIVTGFRSIAADAGDSEDPLDALVGRHLSTVPYAGYHLEPSRMVSDFVDRVRQSGAQGVVFLNPKFCEAAGFDTPDFHNALQEAGIPDLILETSSRGVSSGQTRLRVEAFREMLSGDLP
jgi:benzoyl-CoA reductase subunit C